MSTKDLARCGWCGRYKTKLSNWEYQALGWAGSERTWIRLCDPCATRRLNNLYNALLNMRKIGDTK